LNKILIGLLLMCFTFSAYAAEISYEEAQREVGCKSKYSKAKKKDIFKSKYKGQWMTWSGTVVLPDSGKTSINVDRKGTQDLTVKFSNPRAGYDLIKDQEITVKFKMDRVGGCFLPYIGFDAVIIK
jgi:hypothetical protein